METRYLETRLLYQLGSELFKTGSDGSMYKILKKHGHTLNKLYPALVPLTIEENGLKIYKEYP